MVWLANTVRWDCQHCGARGGSSPTMTAMTCMNCKQAMTRSNCIHPNVVRRAGRAKHDLTKGKCESCGVYMVDE